MKKALLLAILALSINAFAQHKPLTSIPTDIIQRWMEDGGLKSSGIFTETDIVQASHSQTANQGALTQKNDSIYQWQWDPLINGWNLVSKYVNMVYDTNNNLITQVLKNWSNNVWVISQKDTNTYDANNNLKSHTTKNWNDTDTAWVDFRQFTCTYDANNNLTNYIKKNRSGSAWVNSTKFSFTYDANNNQTNESIQNWTGSAWEDHFKYDLTYDTIHHILTSYSRLNWNGFLWEFSYKVTFGYDTQNHRSTALGKSWNGNTWENSYQGTFNYDANNNLLSFTEQKWKGSAWMNSDQGSNTFDANNFLKSESYKIMDRTGTELEGGDSTYYFNAADVENYFKAQEGHINVYPNPSSGKFAISSTDGIGSIEIYNLFGERIYSNNKFNGQTSTEIDLTHYSKGIYLIKYNTREKNYTKTIIIQ